MSFKLFSSFLSSVELLLESCVTDVLDNCCYCNPVSPKAPSSISYWVPPWRGVLLLTLGFFFFILIFFISEFGLDYWFYKSTVISISLPPDSSAASPIVLSYFSSSFFYSSIYFSLSIVGIIIFSASYCLSASWDFLKVCIVPSLFQAPVAVSFIFGSVPLSLANGSVDISLVLASSP